MTIRYLLIVGGTPEGRRDIATTIAVPADFFHEAHDGFTLICSRRGLVFTPEGPTVIGDLFQDTTRIAHGVTSRAPTATPRGLAAAFWGRYVAVWSRPSGEIQVLRDPSGTLPCYYRQLAGHMLVASDLELIERAIPSPRRLDWAEIARILGAGDLRSPATGLTDLRELPAGALLTIEPDRCRVTQIWDPWTFAASSRDLTLEEHATNLRACVDMVVAALGRAYPDALATVSGGLDSSIVALGLGPAARSLTCLTVATSDPSGDERRYARLVAEAVRAAYVERFLDAKDVDLGRSQAAHLPRPLGRPFMQSMAKIIAEAANDAGATAVFNGSGGDNVFCFLQSATPVTDRLLCQGVRRALSTLHDVAAMSNASYLEVASAALRRSLPRNRGYHWRTNARLATGKRKAGRILKIILFGSYARGGWVDEPHTAKGYQSDYDLLIIVNQEELTDRATYWYRAEERFIREMTITHTLRTPVNFIVHTLQEVNDALAQGRFFFMDIARDGIALYQADDKPLHSPKPKTPEQALAMAQEYFEEWFPGSMRKFEFARFGLEKGHLKETAFELHQVVETLYHCVLLVSTFYTPHVHNIAFLRKQADKLDRRLLDAWPRSNRVDRARFEKLKDAYVKARYSKHYRITADELRWLSERIEELGQAVHMVCSDRIDSLRLAAVAAAGAMAT